ncbi:transposase [Pseudofrankia sp. DC12]|uniref:transposase n=1 Tax=Pseudofrankia sp. DC12 TaxID=683315 RepID=UPI00069729B2|nr:transposase [Pseudofrankia sp. DC12]
MADGRREGTDRDHGGRPGRLAGVVPVAGQGAGETATYKGGVGFSPNLATCDNTDDLLVVDPRPGNATSNDAADDIATLTRAVERIPGAYRHRLLIRLDGAGFSHELLGHIASGGGRRGRRWEFSVGWPRTDRELAAIAKLPAAAWTPAIDQAGDVVENAYVAELTGLLDLSAWTEKIPGLRILVRDEPLHPKYLARATDQEKQQGRRYQLIALNANAGQLAWLDARHRSHVHVENDVKQGKAIGLNRWPSRHWRINKAWPQIVLLAGNLLAAYRWLALEPGHLRDASIKLLRFRLFDLPARLTHGQRKRRLHLRADWPWLDTALGAWNRVRALPTPTLTTHPPPRRAVEGPPPGRGPGATTRPPSSHPAHRQETKITNPGRRSPSEAPPTP